jgi:hypothetical protein
MNLGDLYFRNWKKGIERKIVVESNFYFDNDEKRMLAKGDNKNYNENVLLNLLDYKNFNSLYFIISVSAISLTYDIVYKKNKNTRQLFQNAFIRMLVLNSIYYLFFSNYNQFYRKVYTNYYLSNN